MAIKGHRQAQIRPQRVDEENTPAKKNNNGTSYNLIRLLLSELDLDVGEKDKIDSKRLISTEESFEQIMNMIKLPIALENLMIFGILACLNSFLKNLIILPLKILLDLGMLIKLVRDQFINKKKRIQTRSLYKIHSTNIIFASLVFITVGLANVDTSKIYHMIRNQSSIKLYVMFGVLEISDKLLSTVGQDILNVLFSITVKNPPAFLKFLFFCGLSIGYLSLHTIVLIYQTISLTVAANSYSNSLVTLLLSNQFAEIKSSVFKKIDKEGLFQMSCSDIVERFQLILMLVIISMRNLVQINSSSNGIDNLKNLPNSSIGYYFNYKLIGILFGPMMIVIGSEILVDWIKHSYITKFNKIKSKVYKKYLLLLSNDVISNFKTKNFNNYNDDKLQQRLGLPLPALYVLFLVMIKDCFKWLLFNNEGRLIILNVIILVVVYVILVMFKLLLELVLLKWSNKIMKMKPIEDIYIQGMVTGGMGAMDREGRAKLYEENESIPSDIAEQRRKRDAKSKLDDVLRYRMASKRIW